MNEVVVGVIESYDYEWYVFVVYQKSLQLEVFKLELRIQIQLFNVNLLCVKFQLYVILFMFYNQFLMEFIYQFILQMVKLRIKQVGGFFNILQFLSFTVFLCIIIF